MLEAIVARMEKAANPRGCLLTNTSLSFGTGSSRIDAYVAEKLGEVERQLTQAIARARDSGQIPADADPRKLARYYGAVAQSLGVVHKAFGPQAGLRDIVEVAMRSWPARPAKARRGRAKAARPAARNRR
jgi:hypothetical protein